MRAIRPFLLTAVLLSGCSGSEESTPAGDGPSASSSAPATPRIVVAVGTTRGQSWSTLTPKDDGYRLQGGSIDGARLKIDADRVKLQSGEATVAKVKVKDYGFKIYSNDETETVKVKRKGAGFKLSSPEGSEWGELQATGGSLGGQAVVVRTEGDNHLVERNGTVVGTVGTAIGPRAAAFLGVTEVPMEQRVAAMIFVQEKVQ